MQLAYIVKVHKNPAQVRRMISRLHFTGATFLIAVDKKSDLKAFQRELARLPSQIPCHWVLPAQDGAWGEIGIVKSSLQALEAALALPTGPEQIFQISGQCYPIKPISVLVDFFRSLQGKSMLQCVPLPFPAWPGGGWLRVNKYHYWLPRWLPFDQGRREFPVDVPPRTFKEWALQRILSRKFPVPRKFPAGLTPCGGHTWWSMTPALAKFILDFHRQRPDVYDFHRHTLQPDEIYFSSIVGSFPEWRAQTVDKFLHYCDWAPPIHPAVLTMAYAPILQSTDYLLARKFDATVDARILDWIDAHLLGQ